jgi:hypothetical protein
MKISDDVLVPALSPQVDGPPLQGAVYARFTTPLSFTHWLGPLGNYLGARPAARTEAKKVTEETGVPLDAAVVFGVSPTALHIWAADPMKSVVDEYLGAVPRSAITRVTATPGNGWQPLSITLESGHTITVEARGDVDAFVRAFETAASAP